MPLDLSGFVSEPQTFEGLDRLSANLYNEKQQKIREERERKAKQDASTKFIANYLDDKEKYTGTNYDPINHGLLSSAMNDANELIRKGVDISDILPAIGQKVNKAAQYTLNAQQYAANKKEALANVKTKEFIDLDKFSNAYDKIAWEGKDPSQVDPTLNYGDMVLKNEDVFNNNGFKETAKEDKPNVETVITKHINAKGGMERQKVKLSIPSYATAVKNKDGEVTEVVPKFQIATDAGNELIHQFESENGKPVNAPIRLYDKELFKAMPPKEMAYVIQESRRIAKEKGVRLDSTHMENFARALAYDLKKSTIHTNYEHVDETKENPIKIYNISKPTQSEIKAGITQNDLHQALNEQPADADGKVDATPYLGGITFLTNSRGKRISQPSVIFNPKDKTFTFTDNETGQPETVSFAKFKSMATSSNPQSDLGFLEGFRTYKRNAKEPPKQEENSIISGVKKFVSRMFGGQEPVKKTAPKPKANVELDINTLDPNGFKKEGANYRYKDGTLFDANGKVIK